MKSLGDSSFYSVIPRWGWLVIVLLFCSADAAGEPAGPEDMLRLIVEANAARDLAT